MLDCAPSTANKLPRGARTALTCKQCAGVFTRLLCQLGRGRGAYCSKECKALGHRSGGQLHCELCDAPFYRSLSEQDIGEKVRQFCTRDCYMEWRELNRLASTYPKAGAQHLHRVTAEQCLGRPLAAGEVVHHIDLNKANATPENLAVFPSQSHHMRCHGGSMSDDELNQYRLINLMGRSA